MNMKFLKMKYLFLFLISILPYKNIQFIIIINFLISILSILDLEIIGIYLYFFLKKKLNSKL